MSESSSSSIVLGGGCFWCIEALFETLDGIEKAESGYAAGDVPNPTYQAVCTGETGHAEVVRLTFDPQKISLEDILEFFWQAHDPTTLNRQGADVGTQYRSIILYADEAQRKAAEASKARANPLFKGRIVTEIEPLAEFYKAEGYHQDYYANNQNAPYCRAVIAPKLNKLRKRS
jgi:peptide-methionine (S)-S-oxide reductase